MPVLQSTRSKVTLSLIYIVCISALTLYLLPKKTNASEPSTILDSKTENFKMRSRVLFSRTYVYLEDIAKYYNLKQKKNGKVINLTSDDKSLELTLNSRTSKINGVIVDMSFAFIQSKGTYLVSEIDLRKIIDPIFRSSSLKKHEVETIIIDAGHGGKDPGAIGKNYKEKDINLQMSIRLQKMLEEKGYKVKMVRTKDVFIGLTKRNHLKGDLFISIHCNSFSGKSVNGIETFFVAPQHSNATASSKPYKSSVTGNKSDFLNTYFAYEVHKELIEKTKANDRGLKRKRFTVIASAPQPAILIELGFLSNLQEEKNLGLASYQEKLATAIVNGIVKYHEAVK